MDIMKSIEVLPAMGQIQNGVKHLITDGIPMNKAGTSILLVIMAVSVLVCFLGLNIRKVWTTLIGFATGFSLGYYVGISFGAGKMIALAIGAVVGIILAVLTIFLNIAGTFLMCLVLASYTGFLLVPSGKIINYGICVAVGLIIAFVSLKLRDPMTILCTVASGSVTVGITVMLLLHLNVWYYQYIIIAVTAVIGLFIQILCVSQKVVKQDISKAKEIKAQESVENEVEAARTILDEAEAEAEEVKAEAKIVEQAKTEPVHKTTSPEIKSEQEDIILEPEPEEQVSDMEDEFFDEMDEESFPTGIVEDDFIEETEEKAPAKGAMPGERTNSSPTEEAARAKRELEEAKRELERMKKELEAAKKVK